MKREEKRKKERKSWEGEDEDWMEEKKERDRERVVLSLTLPTGSSQVVAQVVGNRLLWIVVWMQGRGG